MMYILDGKIPVKCEDVIRWGFMMNSSNRVVKQDDNKDNTGNQIVVSTVFLGLDHSFNENEVLLFETMVFGGEYNQYQERYSTWDEAEKGHDRVLLMAKTWIKDNVEPTEV